jgi:hypothetical protein
MYVSVGDGKAKKVAILQPIFMAINYDVAAI